MRPIRGFTLLELMVVVAVIAILAMIALPSYSEYVRKGKRAEAVSAIGEIQLREERYRADNPTYGTMAQLFPAAGSLTKYNASVKYYAITVTDPTPTGTAVPTATGYKIKAARQGDMLKDKKCGDFIMTDDSGVASKTMSSGDSVYCWRQ